MPTVRTPSDSSVSSTPSTPSAPSAPSAPPRSPQEQLHQVVVRALDAVDQRVLALVRPLDARQRALPGPNGGWSIDQILEHLCLAGGDYLESMRRAIEKPTPHLIDGQWRPTVAGRILVWSMQSTWRLPAPRSIVPAVTPRARVLDAFLAVNADLRTLLDGARGREWRLVTMSSPYARFARLNLGDAALVLARHAERHAQQMARVEVGR